MGSRKPPARRAWPAAGAEPIAAHVADISRYVGEVDPRAVAAIVAHLGIALRSRDAAVVSCASRTELARVRDGWLRRRLAIDDSEAALDAGLTAVCQRMQADRAKSRVTFYYLLAERFGRIATLAD